MLGDVLLITDKHREAGEAIIQKVLEQRKPKMIITISGESGSGKSELGHVVAKGLRKQGIMAKCLCTDNYYKVLPLERSVWRKKNIVEKSVGYGEYDWDTLARTIDDFKHGREAKMPCVDLVTEQVDTQITDFSSIEMLVIDGLYAIKTEGSDLRVFIELTYHETKKAQVVRGKEPQNDFRMSVLEQEHKMVQALKSTADLLVNMDYKVGPAIVSR